MDERTTFIKRLDRVLAEVKDFKKNQSIGGDSWLVYRTELEVSLYFTNEYKIRFSPETSNDYVAVLKTTDPDRATYGTIGDTIPDPNENGVWWMYYRNTSPTPLTTTFFLYSTVKGTLSVEDVTGQGIGVS